MFILLQSKKTPPPEDFFGNRFFVNRKSGFIRIINHFCGTPVGASKTYFLFMSRRLFTIVEITVVLPVPISFKNEDSVVRYDRLKK
jgi:hypothetical protein